MQGRLSKRKAPFPLGGLRGGFLSRGPNYCPLAGSASQQPAGVVINPALSSFQKRRTSQPALADLEALANRSPLSGEGPERPRGGRPCEDGEREEGPKD